MFKRKVKAPIEEFVEYGADEGEDPREYREIREDEERATMRWLVRDRGFRGGWGRE